MNHNYVRTTIRLPREVHARLLQEAYKQKVSLNEVMLGKLTTDIKGLRRLFKFLEGEKQLEPIRKKYHATKHRYSQTEVIRRMRDELSGRYESDSA